MAKTKTLYTCTSCGSTHHRWMGKCPDCNQWDSLEESRIDSSMTKDPHRGSSWVESKDANAAPSAVPITEVVHNATPTNRLPSGIAELDRVLGGTTGDTVRGLVPGSVVLVGGEPGIGKSTLLLQAAGAWASPVNMDAGKTDWTSKVLYVSSEESAEQIQLRADRLGVAESDGLLVLADTNLARIIEQIRKTKPNVIVIDSIQMIYKADLEAAPGSVTQLRRCCSELVYSRQVHRHRDRARRDMSPKKAPSPAHACSSIMVDAVLYFEGRSLPQRTHRARHQKPFRHHA